VLVQALVLVLVQALQLQALVLMQLLLQKLDSSS
jgi:hypothetical protein